MPVRTLRLSPKKIIRLVGDEFQQSGGQPQLYACAHYDYRIEEDFDRAAYGMENDKRHFFVTEEAVLSVEPRVELNYWVLSVVARKELGPRVVGPENALTGASLTLDEFRIMFIDPGTYRVTVRLAADTHEAREHFDRWWSRLNARHAKPDNRVRVPSRRKVKKGRMRFVQVE